MIHDQLPDTRSALDHFIANVWPDLFRGKTRTDPDYKRVQAVVNARKKELSGRRTDLTDQRIMTMLTKYGGQVEWNGTPVARYSFEVTVVCFLRDDTKKEAA
jgi:hypothetical protein